VVVSVCLPRGGSVLEPRGEGRITKQYNDRLRKALYTPAQVAIPNEPNVRAFYTRLLTRGETMWPVVAII
jgi:hypothetical protein